MDGKEVIYVLIEAICGPQVASKLILSGYDHMQDLIFMDKVQLGEILAKEEERAQLEKTLREDPTVMRCWLGELGLNEHYDLLAKAGFTNLNACTQLSPQSLDTAGIPLTGHKLRLQRAERLGYFLVLTAKVTRDPGPDSTTSYAVKFLVDSASDVMTLRQEVIDKLQLKPVGEVLQKGPIAERRQKLYRGYIAIGQKQIQSEIIEDEVNSVGAPFMYEFRHYIDDKEHLWLEKIGTQ